VLLNCAVSNYGIGLLTVAVRSDRQTDRHSSLKQHGLMVSECQESHERDFRCEATALLTVVYECYKATLDLQ
jgi:hypothetical protein